MGNICDRGRGGASAHAGDTVAYHTAPPQKGKKRLWKSWSSRRALAAAERAEREKRENLLDIQNEKSMELKQDIRKFTEENPEIAAQMIRVWLKGDGVNG